MKKVCKPMDIPGIKACRNNRGYIVVFMSLILLVLMIIVTAVLEIAKLDSGKTKAAAALSTTESDMLAKYQKLCFERYHLLVCDLSDGGKGEAATEEMMKNHLQENLGDELTVDDIAFAGQEYFLEDDYAEFKKQISDQAYYQAALAAVNAIETKTGGQDEPVDHDTIQEMDDDVDNTKEVRELEGMEHDGLNLLSAPGNDLVASTALASSGCQIVLFTTGRGTPFGTFVPTMKVSTNSRLFNNKNNWIDFNAGELVEGTDMPELLTKFIDKVIAVANGEQTRNEANGYREISIFKNGVTL